MTFQKNITVIAWLLLSISLLFARRASAQEPALALSAENPLVQFDWEADTLPQRPLFAVKTNLLFDALCAPNIEIEVPLSARYSVAAEWVFPWWLSDSSQNCFELLCGTIEGRYWFDATKEESERLTGWAAGLYVGAGYYDLERNGVGYQGEFMLCGGISAIYAHPVGKYLRAEYSLGVGVLSTKYRKYEAQRCGNDWNLLRVSRGRHTWFGPTRCRISLVWMLQRKDRRGGAK